MPWCFAPVSGGEVLSVSASVSVMLSTVFDTCKGYGERVMRATFILCCLLLTGCATQHLGREQNLTAAERDSYTCQQIDLEIAKVDGFLTDADKEWSETHARHVLAFFVDFGIGNHHEWSDAIDSADARRAQLLKARYVHDCPGKPEPRPDI